MTTVSDAERLILEQAKFFAPEECALERAYGRILREDIFADRDQPPFHRATMDGIALNLASWQSGQTQFLIAGIQKAGAADQGLKDPKCCLEIMTGAIVPAGSDCVVPYEDLEIQDKFAVIRKGITLAAMQNVHAQASDYRKGERLLSSGVLLNPIEIAIAAAVGKARIKVTAQPRIAIIGTGDELVEIDQPIAAFQTRRSNAYAVEATLRLQGFANTERFHLPDDKSVLHASLEKILQTFDVLILSGGVSMGKFDFVPEALKALGVVMIFHKVQQKPGKPFWFGTSPSGKPVFALPGNPVSTQVCAVRYVLPYLQRVIGIQADGRSEAILTNDYEVKGVLTQFLPVQVSRQAQGQVRAEMVGYGGSGNFAALRESQGFVELSAEGRFFKKGSVVPLFLWR